MDFVLASTARAGARVLAMRMSPQQRLQAFLQRSQLMAALHRGGKALRAAGRHPS